MPCQLLLSVAQKAIKRLTKSFEKRIVNFIEKNPTKQMSRGVARALDSRVITEAFFYSLSTGNFPSVNSHGVQTGVAQQRSNYNFCSVLSQARRIHSGDEKRSIIAQREVRGDDKGFIGPYDTAEGRSCGCNKSFAICTTVSIEFDKSVIETCLLEGKDNFEFVETIQANTPFLVFLNGVLVRQMASYEQCEALYRHLLQYRRCGIIDRGVSLLVRKQNLYIRTDGGRILRPLFVVETMQRHLTTSLRPIAKENFEELVSAGIIEYIDSDEEDTKLVAENFATIDKNTDLCEIHPTLILSFNTAYGAPYCDNNQGPRVTYQNAMMKQSQSQIPLDFYSNMKSRSHSLLYGQKPIAATKLSQVKGFPLASGLNCIVCIGCFDGYNQEDSLVMNRAFIERGGFRMLDQKTFTYSGSEIISNASAQALWKRHDSTAFRHLDDDGMPCPGKTLGEDDIILSKHTINEDEEKTDSSRKAKDKRGTIQRVIFGHGQRRKKNNADESIKVNITSYECRAPVVGDKLASRMAQKGTIARIEDPENLPFNREGIVPDIIINPCCIPTRMTIGQLLEMIGAKAASMRGATEDATAFTHPTVDELAQKLHDSGFQRYGDEQLIDGKTGEMMQAKMFMGICYYQRLKHMVDDKIHARSEAGPRSLLSRQPPSGRSNNGGHRVGEMESIAIIASGASLTHHTLWDQSDPSKWKICPMCGLYNPLSADTCYSCKTNSKPLQEISIPYSFKLLQQELYQCGIMIKDKGAEEGNKHILARQYK